ncbi:hypothetical protein KDM41_09260 [bacterium]|nr:hypothetical protein [bacterium]
MKFVRLLALSALIVAAVAGCSRENPLRPDGGAAAKAVDGLGDRVWLDANGDGIQDEGEPGVEGVIVTLQACTGDTAFAAVADTTDAEGYYLFDAFEAGDYQVHFALPDGHVFTMMHAGEDTGLDSDVDPATGLTMCLSLADSLTELSIDAGLVAVPRVGSIGDRVWHDGNGNGLQDEGEPGLADIVVTLTDCSGAVVLSDTTDADGMYLFAEVAAGDYQVHVMLPDSTWAFAPMHADSNGTLDSDIDPATGATACLTLMADETNLDVDAGLFAPFVGDGCAHGKGYWKNHTDEVEPMLPLLLGAEGGEKTMAVEDTDTVYAVLQQHAWGHPSNGITKLYAQLLTAKINIANGADGTGAAEAIAWADAFLADHDWNDWCNLDRDGQREVNRMLGHFQVRSTGDCGDDHDHDGCGGDDDDDDDGEDDDDDGHGGDDD